MSIQRLHFPPLRRDQLVQRRQTVGDLLLLGRGRIRNRIILHQSDVTSRHFYAFGTRHYVIDERFVSEDEREEAL